MELYWKVKEETETYQTFFSSWKRITDFLNRTPRNKTYYQNLKISMCGIIRLDIGEEKIIIWEDTLEKITKYTTQ